MLEILIGSGPFGLSSEKLERIHWGRHNLVEWLYAVGVFLSTWLVMRALHALALAGLRAHAARTQTRLDDIASVVGEGTYWFFHAAVGLMVAHRFVSFGAGWPYVKALIVLALFVQGGIWAQRAVTQATQAWSEKHEGGQAATAAAGVRFVARLVIGAVVILSVLSNWGVKISAVIAGLGVGGIAAALAVQGVLGDVFAGLSMYFDRPFDIGDSIAVDPLRGVVTKIGVRTTRIRSLDGEEIVIPNGDLVKSRIKNFARLSERRVVLTLGLEYGLTAERIEFARDVVLDALRAEPAARVDRGHFKGFGASSLDFEFVYFVSSGDYAVHMDLQQRVLLKVLRRFTESGIAFAFPTQTVHYVRDDGAGSLASAPSSLT